MGLFSSKPKTKSTVTSLSRDNEELNYRTCRIHFPDEIQHQALYKHYKDIAIDAAIKPSSYRSVSLGKPLKFVHKANKVAIYQDKKLIGYMQEGIGYNMTHAFLDNGEAVIGFITTINSGEETIKIDVAYYRKFDNMPAFSFDSDKNKAFGALCGYDQPFPLVEADKYLYYYHKNVSVCIIKKPKYKKLIVDEPVYFEKEPTNTYDKKAVLIKQGKYVLGYLYQGDLQDIINNALENGYLIKAILSRKGDNSLNVTIAMYK